MSEEIKISFIFAIGFFHHISDDLYHDESPSYLFE